MAPLAALVAALALAGRTAAEGAGLIGYGKSMYYPLCAASCRGAIEGAALLCTPHDHVDTGGHGHGATPPECYATDPAFMQTLALCISKRCSPVDFTADVLETYWRLHLVGGGRVRLEPRPSQSYAEALHDIKEEPTTEYVAGEMLNVTSLVSDSDYEAQVNTLGLFEAVEVGHSRYSLVVLLSGFLVPVGVSALRFLPFPARLRSRLSATFNHPALFGTRHRTPHSSGAGIVPTRGQALFIGYLVLLNLLVCVADIHPGPQPNAWYADNWEQVMGYLANRAGALCFANLSLMFLYSARNNLLLYITDWSHTTYLLLHRWVGYITIIEGAVHCIMWAHWYVRLGTHNEEAKEPYWYWGIIAMLGLTLLYPLSLLPVRRRLYELFLLSHIALTVLVIVGSYLHVLYLYENHWGYEIWMYTAGAVWGADRAIRLWRTLRNGVRRAQISKIDDDYVRIDIEGVVVTHGHVYLYFPTLKLAFWENHPFSVASGFAGRPAPPPKALPSSPSSRLHGPAAGDREEKTVASNTTDLSDTDASPATAGGTALARPRLTCIARVQKGITGALAGRAGSSVPVLVESTYHNPAQAAQLARCTTLVCIAGGVGITTMLPLMRTHPGSRARLYWGIRHASLKDALAAETDGLDMIYSIGQRLDLGAILEEELLRRDEAGLLGIVVSGPAGMADDVRDIVCKIGSSGRAARGFVFLDEAFSW